MGAYKFWNPNTNQWEYLQHGPKGDPGEGGGVNLYLRTPSSTAPQSMSTNRYIIIGSLRAA